MRLDAILTKEELSQVQAVLSSVSTIAEFNARLDEKINQAANIDRENIPIDTLEALVVNLAYLQEIDTKLIKFQAQQKQRRLGLLKDLDGIIDKHQKDYETH